MDGQITVDLGPVLRAISSVNSNVITVSKALDVVDNNLRVVDNNLAVFKSETMAEINRLKGILDDMEKQARFRAAFQRAISEIIRVRQELESKFGNQKLVRDSMLGILQATDTALISEKTISRCTEELMISTPKYWLAPCLIALAGWISNNEALAKRAIAEACKRDREKTCLLFALISRRVSAGRIMKGKKASSVTFEWLAEYFKLQNPFKMRRSIIAYIDAYTNGIFGEDKDNLCNEHIGHWMKVLMEGKPNFAQEQRDYWYNMFETYQASSKVSYPNLHLISPQYGEMMNYIGRIDASEREDGIKHELGNIMNTPVDMQALINTVDDQLMRLVNNYEEGEEELRDEEQYLTIVKEYEGDEDVAKRIMNGIKARRRDDPVDFAQQLRTSVFQSDASVSAKKSAIMLLRPYISEAFKDFMEANKEAYPKEVSLNINESGGVFDENKKRLGKSFVWSGKTEDAENKDELIASIQKKYEEEKKKAIAAVTDDDANKLIKQGKIFCCFGILIIPLFVGIKKIGAGKKALVKNANDRKHIAKYYDDASKKSVNILSAALEERKQANALVNEFMSNDSNESIEL